MIPVYADMEIRLCKYWDRETRPSVARPPQNTSRIEPPIILADSRASLPKQPRFGKRLNFNPKYFVFSSAATNKAKIQAGGTKQTKATKPTNDRRIPDPFGILTPNKLRWNNDAVGGPDPLLLAAGDRESFQLLVDTRITSARYLTGRNNTVSDEGFSRTRT